MLMTILETIIEAKEKVLIFTQYTSMAEILIQLIRKNLFIDPAYLCGSMPIVNFLFKLFFKKNQKNNLNSTINIQ